MPRLPVSHCRTGWWRRSQKGDKNEKTGEGMTNEEQTKPFIQKPLEEKQ